CKSSLDAVLDRAGVGPADVDFLCMYQGTPWLRDVVKQHAGVAGARTVEAFAQTAYIASAMYPASLHLAMSQGLLHDGDVVAFTGGGTGMTGAAALLRWGRG